MFIGAVYPAAVLVTVFSVGRPLGLLFVDRSEAQILDWAHQFMLVNSAFDVCLATIFVLRTTIQDMADCYLIPAYTYVMRKTQREHVSCT